MRMVIGGRCQGKLELVLRQTGYRLSAVCDGASCPLEIPRQPVLTNLHLLVRRLLEQGQDVAGFTRALLEQNPDVIVITDEIGGGIVPAGPFERAWREEAGRACCLLARRSGRVDRVFAGIPTALKQEGGLKILLIRHAKTPGNLEGRYIGRTDEPLAAPEAVRAGLFPTADRVYASPMLRCRQTAARLYPQQEPFLLDDMRECDFGDFEGETYEALKDLPAYQTWIASEGQGAPPHGEAAQAFRARCCAAFAQAVRDCLADGIQRAAFVVHGGSILSVMARFAASSPPRGFYDWQVDNLCGWAAQTSLHSWVERQTLCQARRIGEGANG